MPYAQVLLAHQAPIGETLLQLQVVALIQLNHLSKERDFRLLLALSQHLSPSQQFLKLLHIQPVVEPLVEKVDPILVDHHLREEGPSQAIHRGAKDAI